MRHPARILIAILIVDVVAADDFVERVAPILARNCVRCHHGDAADGGLDLTTGRGLKAGGESGEVVVPGQPDESLLIAFISGDDATMPKEADPLSPGDIEVLRLWIKRGVPWPSGHVIREERTAWWSLQPLHAPLPSESVGGSEPIDGYIRERLSAHGLKPAPTAQRRVLVRRLYLDLTGLLPPPEAVRDFVDDPRPDAWSRAIDRLLASPHYGERWARHWLDVVHYGDTHGYDKDKLRPNAWPYRDYVVRAWNEDRPYGRFVQEQLAGDVLWGGTPDGIEATGFLAAGPWDFIGHAEVPESKIDGRVARHLDRDDMVRTTMETFTSLTVGCAQCHQHKFDPITMSDYYSLQAVFAALDRADRKYDADPRVAARRNALTSSQLDIASRLALLQSDVRKHAGPALQRLDELITEAENASKAAKPRPEFGYHSRIEASPDQAKWVQVDLGRDTAVDAVVLVGCHDTFAGIGAGFGFPQRFRIEISNDAAFRNGVHTIADHTSTDYANPGVQPQSFPASRRGRYVRVTATRLAPRRPDDFIFALGELQAIRRDGTNAARGAPVSALDSIEAPVRWRKSNLVDGYYFGIGTTSQRSLEQLKKDREKLVVASVPAGLRAERSSLLARQRELAGRQQALPNQQLVYTGHVHAGSGNFRGRAGLGPREIRVLHRGQVTQPGELATPGTIDVIPSTSARFSLKPDAPEGARRVALARWITSRQNPLTWRSIANRLWLYHFGRGIVDSPNDFGRMGQRPTHPRLLDWLACELRDGDQSIKRIHRRILNSTTYQQTSGVARSAAQDAAAVDGGNRLLWRQNRRRLDAESIRDAILQAAGRLDPTMTGPGFRDFVLERPEHSPHFEYAKHDPADSTTHRRSIYRFLVRSQPQPFMDTLNCADPSQLVARRHDTLTVLQALSLLNNRFMLYMSRQFAEHVQNRHPESPAHQIAYAFAVLTGRTPERTELESLLRYANQFGMPNTCRLMLNLNEFVFVD